jgi:hypothetical protein
MNTTNIGRGKGFNSVVLKVTLRFTNLSSYSVVLKVINSFNFAIPLHCRFRFVLQKWKR